MEFNQFTRKLAKWAFIFLEYDFDVKLWARIINKDVNRLNRNPSFAELDTIKTCWHGETNLEIVIGCHIPLHFGKWLPKGIMSNSSELFKKF